ncbi:MAG: hypothetical protein WA843_02135 [Candidatus Saccharimonadales bacterium]
MSSEELSAAIRRFRQTHDDLDTIEMAVQLGELSPSETDSVIEHFARSHGFGPNERNVNSYVPWDDPLIPFWCECGEMIYSDTPHFHPDDPDAPRQMSEEEAQYEYDIEHN